jgi:hypothetical protein
LSTKLVPTFTDRGCFTVSAADPFLHRSRYISYKQLLGCTPDPPLLRKPGSAGYRTRTSGSVARNSAKFGYTERQCLSHLHVNHVAPLTSDWSKSKDCGRLENQVIAFMISHYWHSMSAALSCTARCKRNKTKGGLVYEALIIVNL